MQDIIDMVVECERLVKNIDNLDNDMVLEVYDIQKILIKHINTEIEKFGTEYRVQLCKQQEIVLNKIAEFYKFDENIMVKNICTPYLVSFDFWGNEQLLKDTGLTGYFLAKEMNTKHIMYFFDSKEEYPFHKYIPEQELLFLDKSNDLDLVEKYFEYLYKNYENMDILILYGYYPGMTEYLYEYKRLRPDGKVYCALDMNSWWLEQVDWGSDQLKWFGENCDIITTSSKEIKNIMNSRKDITFPCYYLPNSFANLMNLDIVASAEKKKNVILTVGRIGTNQKNNLDLMYAFAKVSEEMEDWTVRLVGSIVPEFNSAIEEYYKRFPNLKNRVIFTGPILDKQLLFNEYAEAKCFVLTSDIEGGTPNVYAEALNHGCKFIVSNIDAAEEMTKNGELGEIYNYKDIDELSKYLINLKIDNTVENYEAHITKALEYANENYDWLKNVKKIAFMLSN